MARDAMAPMLNAWVKSTQGSAGNLAEPQPEGTPALLPMPEPATSLDPDLGMDLPETPSLEMQDGEDIIKRLLQTLGMG